MFDSIYRRVKIEYLTSKPAKEKKKRTTGNSNSRIREGKQRKKTGKKIEGGAARISRYHDSFYSFINYSNILVSTTKVLEIWFTDSFRGCMGFKPLS